LIGLPAIAMTIFVIGSLLWLIMKLVMGRVFSSQETSTRNYAGRSVHYGLGFVWIIWAVLLFICNLLGSFLPDSSVWWKSFFSHFSLYFNSVNPFLRLATPLVIACFFFGWLDDRFGKRGDGGFKGHIKALFHGKITTGMIKVLGIGFTALAVSALSFIDYLDFYQESYALAMVILGGLAIALSANFINLVDLRPARASKVYCLLALVGFFGVLIKLWLYNQYQWWLLFGHLLIFIWLIIPILVVWPYDAGEKAMLGDAGANPAGALLGFYFTCTLGGVGLAVYVAIMLFLNLASEKVSYSALIERTPFLKWLDMLGRPKPSQPE